MKNQNARFLGGSSTMTVYLRTGKRGIAVAASVKNPGEKAMTYDRQEFTLDDETKVEQSDKAQAAFDALKAKAIEKGWTEKIKPAKKVRVKKVRFTEDIPDAPTTEPTDETDAPTTEPTDETDETERPTGKKGRKNGKK